ncbi:MAG: penicillin acylase family protein [Polyangiaceae bacterium]
MKFHCHAALLAGLASFALAGCTDDDVPVPCGGAACGSGGFDGLSAEVRVLRDSSGVVHIYGKADADVMYGAGYAQAVDRLFEMDVTRRRALGRRAELFGEGSASEDVLIRTVDIPRWGRENEALTRQVRPDVHTLMAAWTAGVNARIDEVLSGAAPLPYGFGPGELDYLPERWAGSDPYAIGKLILFSNAETIQYEILATILRDYFPAVLALPTYAPLTDAFVMPPDERPSVGAQPLSGTWNGKGPKPQAKRALPPDAAERLARFATQLRGQRPGGSNNWAIDGRHTDSGKPIISGDPHQQLQRPSLMWAHHMNSESGGGTIDVAGFGFVGGPGVQLGHNQALAWTATTTYPDTTDLWEVSIEAGVAQVGGQQVAAVKRTEQIVVRDEGTRQLEVVEVPGYGVILPDDLAPLPLVQPGNSLMLRWTGMAPTHDAIAFADMSRAQDLDAFDSGVDEMEIGNFNFVAATAEGITYRSSPLVPDRGVPDAATMPFAMLDGSDPATLWDGTFLRPEQMPHSRGGARGWLASANNDPFGFTADGSLVGDPYYFGVFFDPGTRAARIEERIGALVERGGVTLADAQALQLDTHSILADLFVPQVLDAWAAAQTDPALATYKERADLAELVSVLEAWDHRMTRDSRAALVHEALLWFAARGAIADDFGPTFGPIADASPTYALKFAVLTLTGAYAAASRFLQEGKAAVILAALDETAAFLAERFGSAVAEGSTWESFHGTRFHGLWGERLDGGLVRTDGSEGTVNVSEAGCFQGDAVVETHASSGGAIYRMSTGFAEDGVPTATFNYPPGNSGDPDSPHFADTLDDWVAGNYAPLLFRTAEVEADATLERTLER